MQPLAFAEKQVCKWKEKSTAGAAKRASGDRLFLLKRAEGGSPKPRQGWTPHGRDSKAGSVHDSPARASGDAHEKRATQPDRPLPTQ